MMMIYPLFYHRKKIEVIITDRVFSFFLFVCVLIGLNVHSRSRRQRRLNEERKRKKETTVRTHNPSLIASRLSSLARVFFPPPSRVAIVKNRRSMTISCLCRRCYSSSLLVVVGISSITQ